MTTPWAEVEVEWCEELLLTQLSSSTANSTLNQELQETEVFIIDNKRCNKIYRQRAVVPRINRLVPRDLVCATNYEENLCSVSLGGAGCGSSPASDPWVGAGGLGRVCSAPLSVTVRIDSHLPSPVTLTLAAILGWVPN